MNNTSFIDFVNSNIEKYMKEQNHKMLIAFRNIKSEYVYTKEKSGSADGEIIKKIFNKRKETCEIYRDKNLELFEAENREMIILHPFLPVSVPKNVILQYLKGLSIAKDKKNFKAFQDACVEEFGEKVESSIILEHINS